METLLIGWSFFPMFSHRISTSHHACLISHHITLYLYCKVCRRRRLNELTFFQQLVDCWNMLKPTHHVFQRRGWNSWIVRILQVTPFVLPESSCGLFLAQNYIAVWGQQAMPNAGNGLTFGAPSSNFFCDTSVLEKLGLLTNHSANRQAFFS